VAVAGASNVVACSARPGTLATATRRFKRWCSRLGPRPAFCLRRPNPTRPTREWVTAISPDFQIVTLAAELRSTFGAPSTGHLGEAANAAVGEGGCRCSNQGRPVNCTVRKTISDRQSVRWDNAQSHMDAAQWVIAIAQVGTTLTASYGRRHLIGTVRRPLAPSRFLSKKSWRAALLSVQS
jgi:hypothetical protein